MAGKLKFAQNLYLGEGIAPEKLDKLKKRLNKKPLLANVYLITPARNPADQLDIFDARQLVQPHYKDEEFLVLGMAFNNSIFNSITEFSSFLSIATGCLFLKIASCLCIASSISLLISSFL